jgi:hypothetical protein
MECNGTMPAPEDPGLEDLRKRTAAVQPRKEEARDFALLAPVSNVLGRSLDPNALSQEETDRRQAEDADFLTAEWLRRLSARNNQGEPRDTALAIRPGFVDLLHRRFSRQELLDALDAERPTGEWFSDFCKRLGDKPRGPRLAKPAKRSRSELETLIRRLEAKDYARVRQTIATFHKRFSEDAIERLLNAERENDASSLTHYRRELATLDAPPVEAKQPEPAADVVELPSFATAGPKPKKTEVMTADELLKTTFPAPRHAVSHILPEGLGLLGGKPKFGKSFMALNLSLAVCQGGLALGAFRAAKGEVLYLALEDTWRRLQRRLAQIGENALGLHLARQWPRQDQGGILELMSWLEKHRETRLIVIDTWPRFRAERRGNRAYEEDYEHAAQLKWLADHYRLAVVAVVHCRKSKIEADDPVDELQHTTGLTGAADVIMVLRRERGQQNGSLFVTGRDVEERELRLTFDTLAAAWTAHDVEAVPASKPMSVREVLKQAGRPLSPSELAPLLGRSREATKKLLQRLLKAGQLIQRGRLYWVPE